VVTVAGQIDITPTAGAGANTVLNLTVPIATTFAAISDAGGSWLVSTDFALVRANSTLNQLHVNFAASSTGGKTGFFHATYRVII
jgi:hypothetical protein